MEVAVFQVPQISLSKVCSPSDRLSTINRTFIALYRKYMNKSQKIHAIMNCPSVSAVPKGEPADPRRIRLVHHGIAAQQRKLERMIDCLRFLDDRFELHFYLTTPAPDCEKYLNYLRSYRNQLTDRRLFFHQPVSKHALQSVLSAYDAGFYLLPNTSINTRHALHNKFFDFIHAGLCVVVSPNPDMAEIVRSSGFGIVVSSGNPSIAARRINKLSPSDIIGYKVKAVEAASV